MRFIVVVTDRHSKLKIANSTFKPSSTHTADTILDNWIAPFSILEFVLTDNGPQYVSKLIVMLGTDIWVMHLRTTAYNLQTSGRAERFHHTIETQLRNHVTNDH